jgi:IPT/TIG domain
VVQSPAMFATGQSSPVPVAQSSTPSSIAHGSGNFTITVTGSGFVAGSQATWNGADLTTSYISATQLLVYVPAKVVASSGTATIIVTNPAPGGGKSGSLTFTIN